MLEDVYRWAMAAEPGEVKVYHEGPHAERGFVADAQAKKKAVAFGTAYSAHEAGLVFLAQRRIRKGPQRGDLQYLAIRVSEFAARKLGLIEVPGLSYQRVG